MPRQEAFVGDEPLGHVPSRVGRDGELLVQLLLSIDGGHDARRHVLETLEAVQRFGWFDSDDPHRAVAAKPPARSHDRAARPNAGHEMRHGTARASGVCY